MAPIDQRDVICRTKPSIDVDAHESQEYLSKASLLRLVDHLPGVIYRCRVEDGDHYVLDFISNRVFQILGIPARVFIEANQNIFERMMYPVDRVRIRNEMEDALRLGRTYRLTYRLTLPDGRRKWVFDQGEVIESIKGIPTSIGGIIVDISDQKNREMELLEENERLRAVPDKLSGLGPLVGRSEAMQNVYSLIKKAAARDSGVVIYGETGTGKELVANTIHHMSGRNGNLMAVNCGAIPEPLMESEFFGYRKGAFSGATTDRKGFLEAANGGSLFLDEISDISLAMQVKLLRVLETHTYTPLGSSKTVYSDFRIIAATNRDLLELVREGRMRSDFYYRINVLPIHIPPLRERREDINLLIDAFWRRQPPGSGLLEEIPLPVRLTMNQYDWPGNVRELQHYIERYSIFGDNCLSDLQTAAPRSRTDPMHESFMADSVMTAKLNLERNMILKALDQCRWNRTDTARTLGFSIRTLQRKMKQHNI